VAAVAAEAAEAAEAAVDAGASMAADPIAIELRATKRRNSPTWSVFFIKNAPEAL
jgi:hypothetical protein